MLNLKQEGLYHLGEEYRLQLDAAVLDLAETWPE